MNDKIIRYTDIDTTKFTIVKPPTPKDNNSKFKNTTQTVYFVKYLVDGKPSNIRIQGPRFTITSGGLPQLGQFFADNKARANGFRTCYDPSQKDLMTFKKYMQDIDDHFGSTEFKLEHVCQDEKKAVNYEYSKTVRDAIINDDDESVKPDYSKFRIKLNFETGDVETKLSLKNTNDFIKADTIDEVAKYVRYRTIICLIIAPSKFYITKNADPKTRKFTYGLIFKVTNIEVEPPNMTIADNNINPFINDDDDNDVVVENKKTITLNKFSDLDINTNKNDSDDEKKVTKVKTIKKDDSDDDDDDDDDDEEEEEDEKPKVTKSKTPVKKDDSDDDDEEEEPEEPKVIKKKPQTRAKKN